MTGPNDKWMERARAIRAEFNSRCRGGTIDEMLAFAIEAADRAAREDCLAKLRAIPLPDIVSLYPINLERAYQIGVDTAIVAIRRTMGGKDG